MLTPLQERILAAHSRGDTRGLARLQADTGPAEAWIERTVGQEAKESDSASMPMAGSDDPAVALNRNVP